jgi:ABC-type glycerol-3-phosphate transport system substrate-binding protein
MLAEVVDCSNIAEGEANWQTQADFVYDGKAAMYVMGDWAKAYFEDDSRSDQTPRVPWTADVDFGVVPGLGSSGYFTFNSAVFAVTNGAAHPNAARAFISVVASHEGQSAFNFTKGSLPARLDVDEFKDAMLRAQFDDFVRAAATSTADAPMLLPGYATLTSFDFQQQANPALLVFAVGGEKAAEIFDCDYYDCPVPDAERAVPPKDVAYAVGKFQAAYAHLAQP